MNLATNKSQKEAVYLNYTVYSQSLFANQAMAVIEESDEVQSIKNPRYAFVCPLETYYILLSSITIVLYVKEIFENWIQVVNKNQNTKSNQGPTVVRHDERDVVND